MTLTELSYFTLIVLQLLN